MPDSATITKPVDFTVNLPITISSKRLMHLVVGAFEGGSNYWLQAATYKGEMDAETGERVVWWGREPLYVPGFKMLVSYDDPDKQEGNGEGRKVVDFDALTKALVTMGEKYPHHLADFLAENEDATTSDVFMQCAVLGDLVYG